MRGTTVRLLLMIVGGFAVMVYNERPADAQNYPWCAEGSYKGGDAEFCEPNPMYQPPPASHKWVRRPMRRPH